ncbi:2674_t:CDS:2 [Racocetra persica]|uniref:2674_t:CDS:1 n=1 Tax=Racocetra persica TaxID=160502 RepID=A0ACA9LJT0_9GLOM|nr:2674_t:CDS:2 [Racocetra persica]
MDRDGDGDNVYLQKSTEYRDEIKSMILARGIDCHPMLIDDDKLSLIGEHNTMNYVVRTRWRDTHRCGPEDVQKLAACLMNREMEYVAFFVNPIGYTDRAKSDAARLNVNLCITDNVVDKIEEQARLWPQTRKESTSTNVVYLKGVEFYDNGKPKSIEEATIKLKK